MKKIRPIYLAVFIIFGSNLLFAQTTPKPLQIKSGSIMVSGARDGFGPVTLNFENFTSSGNIINRYPNSWYDLCSNSECRSDRTFSVGGFGSFSHLYNRGDFTFEGKTYKNVYHEGFLGNATLPSTITFQIPRITRKRGRMFFSSNINMDGFLLVCKINPFAQGCPPEETLFRGNIYGHGVLRVTMKIRYDTADAPFNVYKAYLKPVSYEYIFQEENPADIQEY